MKSRKSIATYLILIVGVVLLINILSDNFFHRFDFTQDNRYTLSNATKDILNNLTEPVTVTAYFSDNMPPQAELIKRDFEDMLIEYANKSDGMLVYEFISPNEDEELEKEVMQKGVQPVLWNVREKDQVQQQKLYLGAVIQIGNQSEAIPFIQDGVEMEYALSSSIKKLSVVDKPIVGFVQGHGEPSIAAYQEVLSALRVLFDVESINFNDENVDLSKYATLIIAAPTDSFPNNHLSKLDEFLSAGKNLLVAINRVGGDLQNLMGSEVKTGLESWLSSKGITVENNFVLDEKCHAITVVQRQGMFNFQSQKNFPYFPIMSNFEEHPITKGLEGVVFQFVSSLTFSGDSTMRFTPIVKSSESSATQPAPTYFNIQKQWTKNDFPLSTIVVAGALEGEIVGGAMSKMVVFGDGDFAVNGEGQENRQLNADNVSLLVNAVEWLSDDTGLIELRTKAITSRPIDDTLEDSTKMMLKYLNFFLPIVLVLIFGVIRMRYNRSLRIKRMEEDYV